MILGITVSVTIFHNILNILKTELLVKVYSDIEAIDVARNERFIIINTDINKYIIFDSVV
jgi:hypothetical protein